MATIGKIVSITIDGQTYPVGPQDPEPEMLDRLGDVYRQLGKVVIQSYVPRAVGDVVYVNYGYTTLRQKMRVVGPSTRTDFIRQCQILDSPGDPEWDYFYEVESD